MDMEPDRTRDEASREDQDREDYELFPMDLIKSAVGENSQSRDSRPYIALVQQIRSRGFEIFEAQPTVR